MALRVKTVFFKNAGGRSAAEVASVLASTIWRLADNVVANLSKADCDIVTPERGMRILGEVAAFLLHMSDRMLYGRVPEAERAKLIQSAGQRLAGIVQDNIREMVGEDGYDYKANFIELLNRRAEDYATFDCAPDKPSFPLLRYLGLAVRELMLESDQPWVADQVMDIQAPEALGTLKKTVDGLLAAGPGAPRRDRGRLKFPQEGIMKQTPEFRFAPLGWTTEKARAVAGQERLVLGEDHWELIRSLQEFYSRHHNVAINMRELQDALEEKFHHKGGMKYLFTLLPGGPVAQGCRLAGLSAPAGAVDRGFGSVA